MDNHGTRNERFINSEEQTRSGGSSNHHSIMEELSATLRLLNPRLSVLRTNYVSKVESWSASQRKTSGFILKMAHLGMLGHLKYGACKT